MDTDQTDVHRIGSDPRHPMRLGVKPATARVRLHRSRRLVQSHLQPSFEAALAQEVQP